MNLFWESKSKKGKEVNSASWTIRGGMNEQWNENVLLALQSREQKMVHLIINKQRTWEE